MSSTGIAPTLESSRAVVGPVLTGAGFRYWYLACLPDCVVAVRLGTWTGMTLATPGGDTPMHFGLLGVLLGELLKGAGKKGRSQIETSIANTPNSRLFTKPNVVYRKADVRSIICKPSSPLNVIGPRVILEMKNGSKRRYAIQKHDFEKVSAQLKQVYPDLYKTR